MTAPRTGVVPRKRWLGPPCPFSRQGGRGLGAQSRPSLSSSQLGPSITSVVTPQPPRLQSPGCWGTVGGAEAARGLGLPAPSQPVPTGHSQKAPCSLLPSEWDLPS